MHELRWTLLILGVLFIVALAVWERRRPRQASTDRPEQLGHAEPRHLEPRASSWDVGEPTGGPPRAFREPTLTLPEIRTREPPQPHELPVVEITEDVRVEADQPGLPVLEPVFPRAEQAEGAQRTGESVARHSDVGPAEQPSAGAGLSGRAASPGTASTSVRTHRQALTAREPSLGESEPAAPEHPRPTVRQPTPAAPERPSRNSTPAASERPSRNSAPAAPERPRPGSRTALTLGDPSEAERAFNEDVFGDVGAADTDVLPSGAAVPVAAHGAWIGAGASPTSADTPEASSSSADSAELTPDTAAVPTLAEPIVEWPPDEQRKIIALRLVSPPERFPGRAVRQALAAEGFVLGKYSIFHKADEDRRAYLSVASLTKPGTFDLETMDTQRFGGLSLFAVLPGPKAPPETFDELLATARNLNERLQGGLQDEKGGPLTPTRIAAVRESLTTEASS